MRRRWFLPQAPDVLRILRDQAGITVQGMDALVAWTAAQPAAAGRLRECEHRANDCKRALREALTTAFMTPMEPEDLFELSRGLDLVLNGAKNIVREAEVMQASPDAPMGEMAVELAAGVRDLASAFGKLGSAALAQATQAANRAAQRQSNVEKIYRRAMPALLTVGDLREVTAKRELYRRFARCSDVLRDVAERVWYSALKEN